MPNDVDNTLTLSGPPEDIDAFLAAHWRVMTGARRGDAEHLDFQTVIPMPAVLDGIESGSNTWDAWIHFSRTLPPRYYLLPGETPESELVKVDARWDTFETAKQNALYDIYKRLVEAMNTCGHMTWYDWSLAHWGTKWNSYNGTATRESPGRVILRFDTAWAVAEPIFDKLVERWPTLRFEVVAKDPLMDWEVYGESDEGFISFIDVEAEDHNIPQSRAH